MYNNYFKGLVQEKEGKKANDNLPCADTLSARGIRSGVSMGTIQHLVTKN